MAHAMQPTELLAFLVRRKRDLLAKVRQLTLHQPEVIAQRDMSRLTQILRGKQTLLEEIHKIEGQLDPFRQQDPERRRWRSEEDRQQCRAEAHECEQLLAAIMETERECEAELIRQRDEITQRLQGLHSADQARQAYKQAAPAVGGGFDLTAE